MLDRLQRRTKLWIGVAAAVAPLALLLTLQYRWLAHLEELSTLAVQANLDSYLDAITKEVEYFYTTQAERNLSLPVSAVAPDDEDCFAAAAEIFAGRQIPAAGQVLLVTYVRNYRGEVFYYSPAALPCLKDPTAVDAQMQTIFSAMLAWAVHAEKTMRFDGPQLIVDERRPRYRLLLKPVLDERSRLAGLGGMVIDPDYFFASVLPLAIARSLPDLSRQHALHRHVVRVVDGDGELLFAWPSKEVVAADPRLTASPGARRRAFSMLFGDLTLLIDTQGESIEEWARSNFLLNLALTAVLALLLLAGLFFVVRSAAREMRLSQMKADFVANVTHELRTPLASIRVLAELLRLGKVRSEPKIRDYGAYIEVESRRLTQLINNILDFARIESGAKVFQFETLDVAELFQRTVGPLRTRLEQQGFALDIRQQLAEPLQARIDEAALAQALSNLVDNAVKYSRGERRVRITLAGDSDGFAIAVQDWGIGIAADEQSRIFERFHRVATSLVHDVKGAGLGLSIVQQVALAHGGQVAVRSEPGSGSTFSIHLPVMGQPPPPPAPTPPAAIETRA